MADIISNKEIATQLLERQVGNLYESLREKAFELMGNNPSIKLVLNNYIKANENKWITVIQEKLDLIIESSFIDPNISLEDGISNANELINTYIGQFLQEKLDIDQNMINIVLQLFLGT